MRPYSSPSLHQCKRLHWPFAPAFASCLGPSSARPSWAPFGEHLHKARKGGWRVHRRGGRNRRWHRATGDVRYLAFCHHILKAYDQPNGPRVVSTLAQTGSVLKTANAKAVRDAVESNRVLKLYEVTGDKKLLNVALIAWKDVAQNRLYLTGSASSKEHFQKDHVFPGEVKDNLAET